MKIGPSPAKPFEGVVDGFALLEDEDDWPVSSATVIVPVTVQPKYLSSSKGLTVILSAAFSSNS